MNEWITAVNDVIWSYVLIVALVGCGFWFTWRTRFVQFRMVGEMLRLLTESAVDTVEEQVRGDESRKNRRAFSPRKRPFSTSPSSVLFSTKS